MEAAAQGWGQAQGRGGREGEHTATVCVASSAAAAPPWHEGQMAPCGAQMRTRGRFAGNFLFMTSIRLEPSWSAARFTQPHRWLGCGSERDPPASPGPSSPELQGDGPTCPDRKYRELCQPQTSVSASSPAHTFAAIPLSITFPNPPRPLSLREATPAAPGDALLPVKHPWSHYGIYHTCDNLSLSDGSVTGEARYAQVLAHGMCSTNT